MIIARMKTALVIVLTLKTAVMVRLTNGVRLQRPVIHKVLTLMVLLV